MSAKCHPGISNNTTPQHQKHTVVTLLHQLSENKWSRRSVLALSTDTAFLFLSSDSRRTWRKKSIYLEKYRHLHHSSENTSLELSRSCDAQLKWNQKGIYVCVCMRMCMCVCNWVTLLYSSNQHNIVIQLYFNKKFFNKPEIVYSNKFSKNKTNDREGGPSY